VNLELRYGLPFVSLDIAYGKNACTLHSVLIDTGSASSIFSIDDLGPLGVQPDPADPIRTIRGIGGTEVVFRKRLDYVQFGEYRVDNFIVEIGAMDYGFEIRGILGMDLLRATGSVLDLGQLRITFR
jgi:hypothetical protein